MCIGDSPCLPVAHLNFSKAIIATMSVDTTHSQNFTASARRVKKSSFESSHHLFIHIKYVICRIVWVKMHVRILSWGLKHQKPKDMICRNHQLRTLGVQKGINMNKLYTFGMLGSSLVQLKRQNSTPFSVAHYQRGPSLMFAFRIFFASN